MLRIYGALASFMSIEQLRGDEVGTFVDELWVPAQREMAEAKRYTLKDEIRAPGVAFNRSLLDDEDAVTYLARRGGDLVGYVTAEVQTPPPMVEQLRECHIVELFVDEASRRRGVASNLVGEVERWARSRECEYTKLMVSSENLAAIDLYESSGYGVARHSMKKRIERDG